MIFLFLFLLCVGYIDGAVEGEACIHNNVTGVCAPITKCNKILENPVIRAFSPACETHGLVDVVCCEESSIIDVDPCGPLPVSMTSSKTGRKAWDKCIEYQQLVYPCEDGVRRGQCHHQAGDFFGSPDAGRTEFSHAVLLGYENDKNQLDWLAGGSLISDMFILTVAHAVTQKPSRNHGPVTYVAINSLDRSFIDPSNIYKVRSVIRHPEHRPPKTYYDIALVELESPVALSANLVPACLMHDPWQTKRVDPDTVIATTWSTHDVLKKGKTWLRKIHLSHYSIAECSRIYPENRRGRYNDTTQVCYGDKVGVKDICQDDGGNPVVVENQLISCMYTVVGLASYGRGCFAHNPGVYTRVEPYLPWIESIVWP